MLSSKKAENLRKQIETVRKVTCQGDAFTRKFGIMGINGWMFLSEDAVEFYKTSAGFVGENIAILLDDITSTLANGRKLTISTKAQCYSFVVSDAKSWKEQIDQTVAM